MTTAAPIAEPIFTSKLAHKFDKKPSKLGVGIFLGVLVVGLSYVGAQLIGDPYERAYHDDLSVHPSRDCPSLIALAFEFVNGFHDTANAVATVIYTHSLEPNVAVMWSGAWNFIGVLVSTGAVAFGIVSLLPVELILQVGSGAGFAMVFALLAAAIVWNLGTWWFGLPSSSSHTLIGSILGVGIANQLDGRQGRGDERRRLGPGRKMSARVASALSPLVEASRSRRSFCWFARRGHSQQAASTRLPRGPSRRLSGSDACSVAHDAPASASLHGSNDGQKANGPTSC